ncbi:hypothetical protein ACN27G_06110 [Plantactinospora sp. WMMB334]|uniref:hypothetical protein n=1 Tax=Plantactinospora sp. WMMB334 TaxID=3404119 RepID=UPI003B955FF1
MSADEQPGLVPDGRPAAGPPAWVHLDWSRPPYRWDQQARPCRLCGKGAHMRDEHGRPCHKVCAEQAATTRAARAADRYQQRTM